MAVTDGELEVDASVADIRLYQDDHVTPDPERPELPEVRYHGPSRYAQRGRDEVASMVDTIAGVLPVVLVSSHVPADSLTGAREAGELVRRLRAQAPRMPILAMFDGDEEALAQGLHGRLESGQRELGRDQRHPEGVLGQPRQARDGIGRRGPHHPQAGQGAQSPHQIRIGHIIDQ